MKIRNLLRAFVGCALIALATMSVFAQVGRIEGSVVKAGTSEAIVGAEVQIVRIDIRGNYDVKTDKKGSFLHAGVPLVGNYTIIFSAPGHQPYFVTGIKPNGEPIKIELQPGDGRKLSMDDVKKLQSGAPPAGGGGQKQMSAAEMKKAQEDLAKRQAENEKMKTDHESMKKFFDQGRLLADNKDYTGAINAYNEAGKIDPEQQAIWANLALALYNRGVTNLNESIKDPAKRDPAKQDFTDSITAANKALALVEPLTNDPAKGADAKKQKSTYLKIKADSESLLAKRLGVAEMATAAVNDYKEAGNLSENPADKKSYEIKGADTLFESGKAEEAVTAYQAILATDPDNIDALYKLGLAFASVAKFQESANTLQQFIDKAPATDTRVPEVKAVIKDLVVGNNLQPPKADPGRGRTQPARKKP
ncbi:MAG: tetratricopeptide repeat protein [Acidobacteria bacterium]|nr:tetratricopeptide repeat protein [Acidobacteriota bacterium]